MADTPPPTGPIQPDNGTPPSEVNAWTVPTLKFGDAQGYQDAPYSFLNPETTLLNLEQLKDLAQVTGKEVAKLQVYTPERILLQESAVQTVLRTQVTGAEGVAPQTKTILQAIPDADLLAFKTKMEDLGTATLAHMEQAVATNDLSHLNETESKALAQVRGEIAAEMAKPGKSVILAPTETMEHLITVRAAQIVYDTAARAEADQMVNQAIDLEVTQGKIKPLTMHPREDARVGLITGGQASGKGTNVSRVTEDMATASGGESSDRMYVNGDAFKPLLGDSAVHDQSPSTYVKSQLLQNEANVIKGRIIDHVIGDAQIPNIIIDQVFPEPRLITMAGQGIHPAQLVVVGREIVSAIEGSFKRGEKEQRYENTEGILTLHRNVSAQLPGIIADAMGKNVQLSLFDNNGDASNPTLIMRGDMKTNSLEILDPVKAAEFFGKSRIQTNAQSPDQVFPEGSQIDLSWLKTITDRNPAAQIRIDIPGAPDVFMEMKDGKLTVNDPAKLQAALEATPQDPAAVEQLQKLRGLLSQSEYLSPETMAVVKAVEVTHPLSVSASGKGSVTATERPGANTSLPADTAPAMQPSAPALPPIGSADLTPADYIASAAQEYARIQAMPQNTLAEIALARLRAEEFSDRAYDAADALPPDQRQELTQYLSRANRWDRDVLRGEEKKLWDVEMKDAPPDMRRVIGLTEPTPAAGKPVYSVHLGNHRTAVTLILFNQGKIPPDTVVGRILDPQGNAVPLTAKQLNQMYQDGDLRTDNRNLNGDAWVDSGKINGIINDFDPQKFFDPSRDGGVGITLRTVPPSQAGNVAHYSDIICTNTGEPMPHFIMRNIPPTATPVSPVVTPAAPTAAPAVPAAPATPAAAPNTPPVLPEQEVLPGETPTAVAPAGPQPIGFPVLGTALFLYGASSQLRNTAPQTTGQKTTAAAVQTLYGVTSVGDVLKWVTQNPELGGMPLKILNNGANALGFIQGSVSTARDVSNFAGNIGNGNFVAAFGNTGDMMEHGSLTAATGINLVALAAQRGIPLATDAAAAFGGTEAMALASRTIFTRIAIPLMVTDIVAREVLKTWADKFANEAADSYDTHNDTSNAIIRNARPGLLGNYAAAGDAMDGVPTIPQISDYRNISVVNGMKDANGNTIALTGDPDQMRQTLLPYAQDTNRQIADAQAQMDFLNRGSTSGWWANSFGGMVVNALTPGDWNADAGKQYDHAIAQMSVDAQATGALKELNDYTARMNAYKATLAALNPEHPEQAAKDYAHSFAALGNLQKFYSAIRTDTTLKQMEAELGVADPKDATGKAKKAEIEAVQKALDDGLVEARKQAEQQTGFTAAQAEQKRAMAAFQAAPDSEDARVKLVTATRKMQELQAQVDQVMVQKTKDAQVVLTSYFAGELAKRNTLGELDAIAAMKTPAERDAYFKQNANLVAKSAGLQGRKDLGAVALSTSFADFQAKMNPIVQETLTQNEQMLATIAQAQKQGLPIPKGDTVLSDQAKAADAKLQKTLERLKMQQDAHVSPAILEQTQMQAYLDYAQAARAENAYYTNVTGQLPQVQIAPPAQQRAPAPPAPAGKETAASSIHQTVQANPALAQAITAIQTIVTAKPSEATQLHILPTPAVDVSAIRTV
jgi:hypothetical protein